MEENKKEEFQRIDYDETKSKDKEWLIAYYQNTADYWKTIGGGSKVIKRFESAVKGLQRELNQE